MKRPTLIKVKAWDWFWDEVEYITNLSTELDPRHPELEKMVGEIGNIHQQGSLSVNQIQALANLIKASYEAGRKDALNEKE